MIRPDDKKELERALDILGPATVQLCIGTDHIDAALKRGDLERVKQLLREGVQASQELSRAFEQVSTTIGEMEQVVEEMKKAS